jgi:hypothetical protein
MATKTITDDILYNSCMSLSNTEVAKYPVTVYDKNFRELKIFLRGDEFVLGDGGTKKYIWYSNSTPLGKSFLF